MAPENQNTVLRCEYRGAIGSKGGGEPASLTFRNDGVGDLQVFRIEDDGRETDGQGANAPAAIAGAGQQTSLQVSAGDAYLAADAAGNCLGIVQALNPVEAFAFAPEGVAAEAAALDGEMDAPAEDDDAPAQAEELQAVFDDPEPEEPACTPGNAAAGEGCELRGQIASTGSEAASVAIANVGSSAIAVYWSNGRGGEGDYQNAPQPLLVIEPRAAQSFDAYIGYAFTIADVHGKCLGVAQVAQASNAFRFAGVE
ncbi:MAG: hypothetical protein Q8Q62_11640 [Mesorhizobium sp.]|nr:hypothetical protein [Mesorhizobium sp.]